MPADAAHMARALALAALGRCSTFPNPRVGCVIVDAAGAVVGEGWHRRAGEPHAEVHALRQAGPRARGATAYVTLEPCAHHGRTGPCAVALVQAGVARVVAAMQDPDPRVAGRGLALLQAAGIAVDCGRLEAPARQLNRGFLSRVERGRPFVTLKLAASLDGRTAMASGESQWITGEAARADVQALRAEAGAVLCGIGTLLADDPRLTLRPAQLGQRPPDRIVLDTTARAPSAARVWADDGARRFWITATPGAAPPGVQRLVAGCGADGRLDLAGAFTALAAAQVNSVLVECGPVLAGALVRERQADELLLYLAPRLLGEAARPLALLPGLDRLAQSQDFHCEDVRRVGEDLRLTLRPVFH